MTPEEHRFRDQIFVPLQELTEALTEPYHRNRDWSRLHADALALSVSISHIPEAIVARTDDWDWLAERRNAENQCPGYQMIRDFGDTAKHQELNNENRIGSLTTESFFEHTDDEKFKFLRVELTLQFPDGRSADFIECAAAAVDYWINIYFNRFETFTQHLPLVSIREPKDNIEIWLDEKETNNLSMRLCIVKADSQGNLVPTDVPFTIVWLAGKMGRA